MQENRKNEVETLNTGEANTAEKQASKNFRRSNLRGRWKRTTLASQSVSEQQTPKELKMNEARCTCKSAKSCCDKKNEIAAHGQYTSSYVDRGERPYNSTFHHESARKNQCSILGKIKCFCLRLLGKKSKMAEPTEGHGSPSRNFNGKRHYNYNRNRNRYSGRSNPRKTQA